MDDLAYIQDYFAGSMAAKAELFSSQEIVAGVVEVSNIIFDCFENGGKVLLAGNGGSAADCQHIAAEFVSRFFYDRPGLPAIALTTDTSAITAIGNDYGYERLFSRQLQALGQKGDIFIGVSTSGNSKNILEAMKLAKAKGIQTIAFCGVGGSLASLADLALAAPSDCTPHIQECHIVLGHAICALVESKCFPRE